jgi:hypothetical protein
MDAVLWAFKWVASIICTWFASFFHLRGEYLAKHARLAPAHKTIDIPA